MLRECRKSTLLGFYCAFCSGKEKHHPLKCPLLGDLGLKIIEVGGSKGAKAPSEPGSSNSGNSKGATPPAAAPAAVNPPQLQIQVLIPPLRV